MWWAKEEQGHFDRAETRFEQLMVIAPAAGKEVARAVREAYVQFYGAIDRINREMRRIEHGQADGVAEPPLPDVEALVRAYYEFRACIEMIDRAVEPELRSVEARVTSRNQ